MRDKHYPNRSVRIDDDNWENLKIVRAKSNLSWNLFVRDIVKAIKAKQVQFSKNKNVKIRK